MVHASRRETAASAASRRRRTPSAQLEVQKLKEIALTWHVFPVHDLRLDVRREVVAAQLADVLPARFAGVDAGAASRPHALSLGRSRRFCRSRSCLFGVSGDLPRSLGRRFGFLCSILSRAVAAVPRFESG